MSTYTMTFLVFLLFLFNQTQQFCFAYDCNHVHPNLNEASLSRSKLDAFMKLQLHFKDGTESKFQGKKVWNWVREGGKLEDDSPNLGRPNWRTPVDRYLTPALGSNAPAILKRFMRGHFAPGRALFDSVAGGHGFPRNVLEEEGFLHYFPGFWCWE